MDKRKLHHLWTKIRRIKPVYFLALAILSGVIAVFALRANNQQMLQLREAVYTADKNNTDVERPLKALQAYVTSHMNTDLSSGQTTVYPPVQLKYTYERLVQANKDKFAAANTQLYSDAQRICEQQNPTDFSGRNRIPCIEQYVTTNSAQKAPIVHESLYKFAFVSPRWSPDLAGWSIVVSVLSSFLFVVSFIVNRWFRQNI